MDVMVIKTKLLQNCVPELGCLKILPGHSNEHFWFHHWLCH